MFDGFRFAGFLFLRVVMFGVGVCFGGLVVVADIDLVMDCFWGAGFGGVCGDLLLGCLWCGRVCWLFCFVWGLGLCL